MFPRPSFQADRGHGFGRSCAPAAQQERTIADQQLLGRPCAPAAQQERTIAGQQFRRLGRWKTGARWKSTMEDGCSMRTRPGLPHHLAWQLWSTILAAPSADQATTAWHSAIAKPSASAVRGKLVWFRRAVHPRWPGIAEPPSGTVELVCDCLAKCKCTARQASVVQTGCAPEMAWASLSPP